MDRITWLNDLRHQSEKKFDLFAPLYWKEYGLYDNTTHLQFLREYLDRLPERGTLLDAACGAGRYLPFLLEAGHSVIGIDQSLGMLENARGRFPSVPFEKIGLQEMAYRQVFDGATCMDAMENVPPEDWLPVLGNFHQALKPAGLFYFTVETLEMADEDEIRQAFEKANQAGLPVVYGEWPDEGVYHYHPSNQQVRDWVRQAGFEILREGSGESWYYHILAQPRSGDL
jgi:SAM-dependent methyltransferase